MIQEYVWSLSDTADVFYNISPIKQYWNNLLICEVWVLMLNSEYF